MVSLHREMDLTEEATFNYSPGYKWMGQIKEGFHFDAPETMAKNSTILFSDPKEQK